MQWKMTSPLSHDYCVSPNPPPLSSREDKTRREGAERNDASRYPRVILQLLAREWHGDRHFRYPTRPGGGVGVEVAMSMFCCSVQTYIYVGKE